MSKAPFFISPPRTRSSVLFQLMQPYAIQKLGLKPVYNHIELFLEFSHNNVFTDLKTQESELGELYPVVRSDGLHVHFISPPVFKTAVDRNLHKLNVLKQAKSVGNNYYIKGTVNIVDTTHEVLDFFSDRHIVITKRRDIEQYVLSYMYASTSKLFNARSFNVERYMEKIQQGVTVDVTKLDKLSILLNKTKQVYDLETQLKDRNIEYTVTYYEDMANWDQLFDTATSIYGTSEWQDFLPDDYLDLLPIKVEKDYSACILNYDEIIDSVRQQIKDSGIE